MNKKEYLKINESMIKDKIVVDLACHDGESTALIQSLGSEKVLAVEIREHLLSKAQQHVKGNVQWYHGDITNAGLIVPLIEQSNTVIVLGVLYHLFDHFRFLSNVLRPNIEHCLIETVCGPESLNPEMFWGFEKTNDDRNGFFGNHDRIAHGTPNTAWIIEAAKIFGFECDWIHYYGHHRKKNVTHITMEEYINVAGPDWPGYDQLVLNQNIPVFVKQELEQMLGDFESKRMILRLYNTEKVNSTPLSLKDIYYWPL